MTSALPLIILNILLLLTFKTISPCFKNLFIRNMTMVFKLNKKYFSFLDVSKKYVFQLKKFKTNLY